LDIINRKCKKIKDIIKDIPQGTRNKKLYSTEFQSDLVSFVKGNFFGQTEFIGRKDIVLLKLFTSPPRNIISFLLRLSYARIPYKVYAF
jgi:hypothetical protein